MNVQIATFEDLETIVEIYNQAIAAGQKTADITPVTTEDRRMWFEDHTPDKYPILVAEEGNVIVGYLTISAYRPGRMAIRQTAEVSYFVDFEHHRQGVASSLLRYAIGMCPSLQIKTLFAILIDNNDASIRLLEKYGFTYPYDKYLVEPQAGVFLGRDIDTENEWHFGLQASIKIKF